MKHVKDNEAKGSWVTYRPEIKILDCTVRDGGLINDHMFEDGFVKAVYDTCVAAGVDYMELGYKASIEHLLARRVRRLEVLRRGRHPPGRSATTRPAAQALRHGRRGAHATTTRTSCRSEQSVLDVIRVA